MYSIKEVFLLLIKINWLISEYKGIKTWREVGMGPGNGKG